MEFTRNCPIRMDTIPISNQTLIVKFKILGSRSVIKINICAYIHFKNPIHSNMIDVVCTDVINIYSFTEDKLYKILIKIPEFKNRTQSYLIFSIDHKEDLKTKAFIEDIELEISSKKIDKSVIEEIPIPVNPTIDEMIDRLTCQFYRKLPIDSRNRISYIYPLYNKDSFHIVASNHTEYLRRKYLKEKYVEIDDIDWSQLSYINWNERRNILVHPFLYPFVSKECFKENLKHLAKLLSNKNKIGGFDVADSNRISKLAVQLVNRLDLMIVPSNFAKDAYIKSGVTIPVEILSHGIPNEFLTEKHLDTNNADIIGLKKRKSDNIFILFFLIHSEYRKGADLVKNVMKKIQKKFRNVYLVVKTNRNISYFADLQTINIFSWMNNNDLRLLYDTCDICLSPSRGGGFELNALEAISRGIPTLVTNGCCFLDLIDYFIPININNKIVQSLPGNPIHIGYGCEVDINDFERKLIDVIERLEDWKHLFKTNSIHIRERYSWENTANILDNYLKDYGFIN